MADETNVGQSQKDTEARMADPQNIDNIKQPPNTKLSTTQSKPAATTKPSSEPNQVVPAYARFKNGDQRVRLIVPESYLIGPAAGPVSSSSGQGVLARNGGIIFPYTPTINLSHKATYANVNTMHSNYTQYFYKSSAVSEIKIEAKFTVKNSLDGAILLAVQHLCKALTKMQFGNDPNAGSPPPICRLMAYGDYQLDSAPVAVQDFSVSYPENVDYFTVSEELGYGITTVPVLCTLSLGLIPMYSRNEMLNATVSGWLTGEQRLQGFL